jgi:hypothetical protein
MKSTMQMRTQINTTQRKKTKANNQQQSTRALTTQIWIHLKEGGEGGHKFLGFFLGFEALGLLYLVAKSPRVQYRLTDGSREE